MQCSSIIFDSIANHKQHDRAILKQNLTWTNTTDYEGKFFKILPTQGKWLQFNTPWLPHAGSNGRWNNLKTTSTQTIYSLGDLTCHLVLKVIHTDWQTRFASDLGVCMQSIRPQKLNISLPLKLPLPRAILIHVSVFLFLGLESLQASSFLNCTKKILESSLRPIEWQTNWEIKWIIIFSPN